MQGWRPYLNCREPALYAERGQAQYQRSISRIKKQTTDNTVLDEPVEGDCFLLGQLDHLGGVEKSLLISQAQKLMTVMQW